MDRPRNRDGREKRQEPPSADAAAERRRRLAEALRRNLHRRKDAGREASAEGAETPDKPGKS